jgi:hypothetical protein
LSVEETSTPSTRKGWSYCNGSLLPSQLYVKKIYKTPRDNIWQVRYTNGGSWTRELESRRNNRHQYVTSL